HGRGARERHHRRACHIAADLRLRASRARGRRAIAHVSRAAVRGDLHRAPPPVRVASLMARPSALRTAERAGRAALDKKAVDLAVLDVQGISTVTDYFLVCSGKSTTHVRTISDAIRQELKADGVRPLHAEGRPESGWVLLDYGDV